MTLSKSQFEKLEQARPVIDSLIKITHLQVVATSREHADRLIREAERHTASARIICTTDLEGAYSLLYAGARKALTALLEIQGLRPTATGGHVVIYETLYAQLESPMERLISSFNRMRRNRNSREYPSVGKEELSIEVVREDLEKSEEIIMRAKVLLDELPIF